MSRYGTGLYRISQYPNVACTALNGGYVVAARALSMLPSCSYITTV